MSSFSTRGIGDTDGEAWRAAVHGVTKGQTPLSDWTELQALVSSHQFQFFMAA